MINKIALFILLTFSTFLTSSAQVSPWGTGTISNQSLSPMNGAGVYTSHVTWSFDVDNYLATHTYNIYIPSGYDGTTPYGIVTFINSGNTGAIFSSWIPVLEEKNLIMISGNGIGNSIPIIDRSGVALAGSEKLREILNIDSTRIYTSGNSGGARTCADLIFFFPEIFTGMLSNCGSAYLREVDQDYETYQPNSHYEYAGFNFWVSEMNYVKSFDRKYAMMTSFNDFREGDIMNIYHNGMEEDGVKSKFLEIAGGHCTTSTEHFRDAINFVEHPHINVILDSFALQTVVGNGFKLDNANILNQQLAFNHNASNIARAYSKDPFLWNDDKGGIIRTSVEIEPTNYNNNSYFNIGLLDFGNPSVYNEKIGHKLYDSVPNLLVNIVFDGIQPTVNILAENPDGNISNDTLFIGTFVDWSSNEPLPIKYHIWNQEVRIEFGNHFNPTAQVNSLTKLLDDNRSVRIRTDSNYWAGTDFNTGTLLTFAAGKLDTLSASSVINLNFVEVIAADTLVCNSISTMSVQSIQACNSYTWIDGINYTSSNNSATFNIVGAAANGCDSLVTLDLTISHVTNNTTTSSGAIITANNLGANYQWLDCDNSNATIPGENAQSYTALSNGNYAVELTENGCVDTSACVNIITTAILENNFGSEFSIYPNPTKGNFSVDLDKTYNSVLITITDLTGRLIESKEYNGTKLLNLKIDEPAGMYLMSIESGDQKAVIRLVKE
ncbi:MAG: T9SS type A sorting domain-containing protein [Vicingaceae bacterium]|nr:T9SS type A sorting domain-containing protein [Vicingaceae bacterium]